MKRKVLIGLITISLLLERALIYHLFSNSNNVLEEVRIVNLKNDKTLSIMVQEEGTTFKEATDRSKWPDINTYVYDKAECTDSDGKAVDYKSVLTFNYDNKTTTIKTKNTIYCTLYFVKGKASLQLLQTQGSSTFKIKSGMYRFIGTEDEVTHNYICFGTTIKDTCTGNPDEFMYRIIGLTSEADDTLGLHANQLKIIKAKPSSTSQLWHSSNDDTKWDDSNMKTYLNTKFLNGVKWETPTYWKGLITSQKWYNVDQPNRPGATEEPTGSVSEVSQIGLMYATDFVNAYEERPEGCWLHVSTGAVNEWTMSVAGRAVWFVNYGGILYTADKNEALAYGSASRPVFYLQPGVTLVGEGSTTDPFRIAG